MLWLPLLLACGGDDFDPRSVPLPDTYVPIGDEFLVVVLPDTQVYAQSFPETFDSQLSWVAEWADEYNIVFVTHVGDIVQHGDIQEQWDVAQAAYDWLEDIDLPHGFSIGGHDFWVGGDQHDSSCSVFDHMDCGYTDFLREFGPDRYEGRTWFGGRSPSGASTYQRVSVGDMDLLFLHMPQDTPRPEVDWANEILDANPGTLAHLTTHRYLFDYRLTEELPEPLNLLPAGRFNAATYLFGGQSQIFHDSLTADELFDELISPHPNIWGVHCGHVDAEFTQSMENSAGLPVHEVLVDYQNMSDGGGGWLRLLKFQPSENQIEVYTLSTLTGELRKNGDGFEHSIEILDDYKDTALDELSGLGFDTSEIEGLLDLVKTEGTPERELLYDSLYSGGQRDSRFTLDVAFDKYIEASR